MQVSI